MVNLSEVEGVKYSRAIYQIEEFDHDGIESISVGKQHAYAKAKSGSFYFWGLNQKGLAFDKQTKY